MTGALANLARVGALTFAHRLCARHGVALADVLGRRRLASLVRARHELWRVTHDTLGLSLTETAAVFGTDHSQIMYACRKAPRC